MKRYFVTFRSVTYAQRGESALHSTGIRCMLQRTPRWMEEQGCGYCLQLRPRDLPAAIERLKQKQLPFRKIYGQMEDGTLEEVWL